MPLPREHHWRAALPAPHRSPRSAGDGVECDELCTWIWGRLGSPFQGLFSQVRFGSLGAAQGCDRAALRASED